MSIAYFHTIKSILNLNSTIQKLLKKTYFHTIKSILNILMEQELFTEEINFHTIKSILNSIHNWTLWLSNYISILLSLF